MLSSRTTGSELSLGSSSVDDYRQGEGVYRSFSAASGLLNSNLLGGADVLPHTHESEMQFHLLACLDGLYGYVLLILRPDKWAGITQRNQRSQKNFRPAQMEDLQRLALRPYGEASSTTVRSDRPQCPRPSAAA